MNVPTAPAPPARVEPSDWEHYELQLRVREAVLALPNYFETATFIEGMLAGDIFTLNAAFGATIEEQVVTTLNTMRPLWDPDRTYQSFAFVRQSQTFPDVLLRRKTNGREILLGIELKGWYLLAKEGMPNFRFTVNENACSPWDLIVVVPWVLSNVLSGSPVVHGPFVEIAKFAAQQRNYYWLYLRSSRGTANIELAQNAAPYPSKSDHISDRAVSDSGGNFGRLARYGIMKDYVDTMMETQVRGIRSKDWLSFFRRFARDD